MTTTTSATFTAHNECDSCTSRRYIMIAVNAMHCTLPERLARFCEIRKEDLLTLIKVDERYFTSWHDFTLPDGGPALHIHVYKSIVMLEDTDILEKERVEFDEFMALLDAEEEEKALG